jgi:hypothetical protein
MSMTDGAKATKGEKIIHATKIETTNHLNGCTNYGPAEAQKHLRTTHRLKSFLRMAAGESRQIKWLKSGV